MVTSTSNGTVSALSSPGFQELGVTGLKRSSGFITESVLRELQGERGRKTFHEMSEVDPVIGALLFTIDMLMRQVKWEVVPFDKNDEKSKELANFVDSALQDLQRPFKDVVSEIMSMLVYGWDSHEVVFKLRQGPLGKQPSRFNDNRFGWERIAPRSQHSLERWVIADNGDLLGWIQRADPDFRMRPLDINRLLHFRTTTKNNNPEGKSILQNAYRPWYIKKNIENIQAIGIERDLAGLPVLYMPPEYLTDDADEGKKQLLSQMKEMLRNIRRDEQEGLILPRIFDENGNPLMELVLMTTGGRRQFDTIKVIQYYDARMAMTAMADFILLGHEIHGSFSLADNKTTMLTNALGAYMDVIADQFNRKAIPQLLQFNGLPFENPPQLTHGDVESPDLGVLGTFIQQLAGAGFVFGEDDDLENFLRRAAGVPEKSAEV